MRNDIQRIGQVVESVNQLVRMDLLQAFTADPYVYVVPSVLQLKDKKYMHHWCQNILRVWMLSYAHQVDHMEDVVLHVFDKFSGVALCSYSESKGLVYS